MKNLIPKFAFVLLVMLSSCNSDDDGVNPANQLAGVSSQLCTNITGLEGLYWDISNGALRGDIPGGVPLIKNPGGGFVHSAYPPLGFTYPVGYTPSEISDAATQAIGVNLLRNDNRALWRYQNNTFLGSTNANQVMQVEMNQLLNFLGNPGNVQRVCSNSGTEQLVPTLQSTFSSALVRAGDFTALLQMNVHFNLSTGTSVIFKQVTFAPTAEFGREILDTFLPIHFQLLINDKDVTDTDGDGVPDRADAFPFDPTKS